MTGLQLAGRLRAEGTGTPVLLITAAPTATVIAGADAIGNMTVLAKPFDEDEVLCFVDDHC
jgi:DNA-binding response OmpR family regulator